MGICDCHAALLKPLKYQLRQIAWYAILNISVAWLLAMIFTVPCIVMIARDKDELQNSNTCEYLKMDKVLSCVIPTYLVPMLLVLGLGIWTKQDVKNQMIIAEKMQMEGNSFTTSNGDVTGYDRIEGNQNGKATAIAAPDEAGNPEQEAKEDDISSPIKDKATTEKTETSHPVAENDVKHSMKSSQGALDLDSAVAPLSDDSEETKESETVVVQADIHNGSLINAKSTSQSFSGNNPAKPIRASDTTQLQSDDITQPECLEDDSVVVSDGMTPHNTCPPVSTYAESSNDRCVPKDNNTVAAPLMEDFNTEESAQVNNKELTVKTLDKPGTDTASENFNCSTCRQIVSKEQLSEPVDADGVNIDLDTQSDTDYLVGDQKDLEEQGAENPAMEEASLADIIKVHKTTSVCQDETLDVIEQMPSRRESHSCPPTRHSSSKARSVRRSSSCNNSGQAAIPRKPILRQSSSRTSSIRKSVKFASNVSSQDGPGSRSSSRRKSKGLQRRNSPHPRRISRTSAKANLALIEVKLKTEPSNTGKPSASDTLTEEQKQSIASAVVKPPQLNGVNPGQTTTVTDYLALVHIHQSQKLSKRVKRQRNILRLVLVLYLSYLVLYTPYYIAYTVRGVCPNCRSGFSEELLLALQWLVMATSIANPLLYFIACKDFRAGFTKIAVNRRSSKQQIAKGYPN